MVFRYYSNALSQASRSVASAIMIVGLLLIGFGVLIAALPQFFAYLAAGVFFVAGLGCGITAIKIFWAQSRIDRAAAQDEPPVCRENVRIHTYHSDEL
ncbi:hypothetical protein [Anaerobaca lacustris]|uniref:Uncharacterized protein n=1 Tax=Anaerobaca lacustris TaxID=3044600 RepID=A0AAW6TYD3_9BACT|nr:hypothetical protein [Sedimentisphaerales bacterium M17dextr]